MSTWSDMNPAQRNHLVGSLMGAKMLSQCYLAVDGKRVLVTPYAEEERGKVELSLNVLRSSDETWEQFKASNSEATDEWRAKLEIDVERWHLNYCGTPGGAWMVVEWLRDQGFRVGIHVDGKDAGMPYFISCGNQAAEAGSFPEVVCVLLLKLKAPEALIG